MSWLSICIDVEQHRGKDAVLWKAILLSAQSAAFAYEVDTKCLFDSMFWISYVSASRPVLSRIISL